MSLQSSVKVFSGEYLNLSGKMLSIVRDLKRLFTAVDDVNMQYVIRRTCNDLEQDLKLLECIDGYCGNLSRGMNFIIDGEVVRMSSSDIWLITLQQFGILAEPSEDTSEMMKGIIERRNDKLRKMGLLPSDD